MRGPDEERSIYRIEGEEELLTPQLVVYKDLIKENLKKMIEIAGGSGRLWPHVKTHKMLELVKLQRESGIERFKCATIAEAQMCGMAGAGEVVLAYPLVGPNIARFLELMSRFPQTDFYAVGDSTEWIKALGEAARKAGETASVLMDVDVGQHRTGVPIEEAKEAYRVWAGIPGIRMRGLHCYDGHRHESDAEERRRKTEETDRRVKELIKSLGAAYDCSVVIMGGTPSFPCYAALNRAYLSPGTCLLQDEGYRRAYPDMDFVPAAIILTRVISRPSAREMTLDMGNKAVASDPVGERAVLAEFPEAETVLHNEEHWVVRVPEGMEELLPGVGSVLHAIPMHVCPTSALYPEAAVAEGGRVRDWWEITARNRRIDI